MPLKYGGAKSISPGRTPAKCTIVKVARTAPFRLSPVCGAPVPEGQGVSIPDKIPGEPPYTQAPGDGPLCAALLRADLETPTAQAIPMCAGFPTTPPALVVPAGVRPAIEVVEEKRLCDFQAVALILNTLFYYEIWSNDNCNIISLQNEVVTIPPLPDMPLTWSSESHLWLCSHREAPPLRSKELPHSAPRTQGGLTSQRWEDTDRGSLCTGTSRVPVGARGSSRLLD